MKDTEIDRKNITGIKKDFIRLSQRRYSRMESSLSGVQADKLKLIPLLFHVNHPMLPGYVDKFTPCGIPNYTPSHLEKQIAKTVSQSFEYKPKAHLKYRVTSLFLMGSMGTLGQSNSSDIDLWVCLEEALDSKLKEKLLQKAAGIKLWLSEYGIELNSYVVTSDEFSEKKSKKIERDNCGNTQNYLLLDEFYRTAVWISGRWPLWWIIPNSASYSDYAKRLLQQKHIDPADWIDFGEVKSIPAPEYFSAALWQLYKAIESPYKSSVKLLVLEVYAKLFPCAGVLSEEFKQLVYDGRADEENIDPYLLTLNFAEKALENNPHRLEFLRRAFYLKANIKVSFKKEKKNNWQYQTVKQLAKNWGWTQPKLDYLNGRNLWTIKEVKEERKNLVRELTNSYHFLSNFSRVHGVINLVAKNDLLSLGRKLYSAFERRSGKIEILNNGIAKDIFEPAVTIKKESENKWLFYIGHIESRKLLQSIPVHTAESLFECLFWGCANSIVSSKTRLHIFDSSDYLNLQLANEMLRDIESLIKQFKSCQGINQFETEAKIVKIGIFINTRNDPLSEEKKSNFYRVGEGSDCLSWADNKVNLASHFDVVLFNSWGEISTRHYSGEFAWVEFYKDYAQVVGENSGSFPVFCRGLVQRDQIVQRVEQLLTILNQLRANSLRSDYAHRYIMMVSGKPQIIDIHKDHVAYTRYSSMPKLYDGLSENTYSDQPEVKIKFTIDDFMEISPFITSVAKRRFSDSLDFFVSCKNKNIVEVIIRSANGSMYFQAHRNINITQVINHYQQFFEKIQNRSLLTSGLLETVNYYQLIGAENLNSQRFKPISPKYTNQFLDFSQVQAIATQKHVFSAGFDLYTANSCFLFSEHGEGVYQKLRDEILSLRKDTTNYPIFLTDVDLSAIDSDVSIVESLIYKKTIETKLNKSK